jgi:hypothetical protein
MGIRYMDENEAINKGFLEKTDTNQLSASVDTGEQPIDMGDQPIDTGLDVTPEQGKEPSYRGKDIADIAFPVLGGVVGGVVSAGSGTVVGAAAGKGLQGAFEKLLFEREKKLFPKTIENFIQDDTILGNMVKEGIFTAVGGPIMKVGGKVLKPLSKAGKSALKPFEKALSPSKFAQTKGGPNAWQKTVNWLQGVVDEVPEESRDAVISNIARSGEEKGVLYHATERVLERGPKNILTPENLKKPGIDEDVVIDASHAFDNAFKALRKQFKEIEKKWAKEPGKVDLDDVIKDYRDELSKVTEEVVNKRGNKKLVPKGASLDDSAVRQLDLFQSNIDDFLDDPTVKHAHQFKQKINDALNTKGIRENHKAKSMLYEIHGGARDKIDDAIPGYKKLTDEYRDLYGLQGSLKNMTIPERVEQVATSYFGNFKSVLRSKIDELASKNDDTSKVINALLDQRAAKYFRSATQRGGKNIGIPFTKGLAGVQVGAKSPSGFGKSLIGAESRGFRTAAQRGLRGGADVIMGQEAGRVTGSSAPELRRLLRSKEEGGR